MVTFLIEILELTNFGRMTTSTSQFELGDKFYFFNVFLRRPRVANFADIIAIATIFVKSTLKDSKNGKII